MSNYQELFAGRKTRAKFEEIKDRLECKHCDQPALIWLPPESERHAPGGKIVCNECGCFQDWLSIEKNEKKRQATKYNVDEIWEKYGDRCSFCGIHRKDIERFEIGRSMTVQHAPPLAYANGKFNGVLIPCCEWCQQQTASWQKRITTLVEKLATKWDMKK